MHWVAFACGRFNWIRLPILFFFNRVTFNMWQRLCQCHCRCYYSLLAADSVDGIKNSRRNSRTWWVNAVTPCRLNGILQMSILNSLFLSLSQCVCVCVLCMWHWIKHPDNKLKSFTSHKVYSLYVLSA